MSLFRHRFIRFAVIIVLCMGLGQRVYANTLAHNANTQQQNVLRPPDFRHTLDFRRSPGFWRLIVGVRLPDYQPEGLLKDSVEIGQQRANIAQAQALFLERYAITHAVTFPFIPFVALKADDQLLEALRADPDVVSIEDDIAMPPALAESGPLIGANYAWTQGYTGAGQAIAILDTGVDKIHPFLSGKVVAEACYSNAGGGGGGRSLCPGGVASSTAVGSGMNCPTTIIGCPHGTHVAGIAAGQGPSFSGIAKDAEIIAIQVFTEFTATNTALSYTSDQILGLQRVQGLAGSMSIAAANLSLGNNMLYSGYCNGVSPSMKTAVDNLRSLGIATIIAAGNNSYTTGISFPACISSAISVGATKDGSSGATPIDSVWPQSNSASFLKLLAPGQWIYSSVPGGGYANFAGTSMAAPHVAGAWAVLKQIQPTATVDSLLNLLTTTGLPITDTRNGVTTPRLRLDQAVAQLDDHTLFLPLAGRACIIPVADPSFETFDEGGNPYWDEASTNFVTPLCQSLNACGGASVYTGPHTGIAWAWFGGTPLNETASLSQTITFPLSGTATLSFYFWIGAADSGSGTDDVFEARLDGVPLFHTNANQQSQYPLYTLVNLDASAYTDGLPHTLEFYTNTSGQRVNFNIDDVWATCGP